MRTEPLAGTLGARFVGAPPALTRRRVRTLPMRLVVAAVCAAAVACTPTRPAAVHPLGAANAGPGSRSPSSGTPTSTARPPPSATSSVGTTGSPLPSTSLAPPPTTAAPPPGPVPLGAPAWLGVAGDGTWRPAAHPVGGGSAIYLTTLHHLGAPIGVAWLDTSRIQLALYAGTSQPGGAWSNEAAVPRSRWPDLLAAFNSGFLLNQSEGGWYLDGHAALPLRDGAASLVIRDDGSATVGLWGRDVSLTPDVVAVRQNLGLLVDAGAVTPASSSGNPNGVWGATLGGRIVNWRSAVGVDAAGHLLYVAGPALDPPTLAAALVAAGAERAMELDINPAWVSFDTFAADPSTAAGSKLLDGMSFPVEHFLSPYFRDFFAVFVRRLPAIPRSIA